MRKETGRIRNQKNRLHPNESITETGYSPRKSSADADSCEKSSNKTRVGTQTRITDRKYDKQKY